MQNKNAFLKHTELNWQKIEHTIQLKMNRCEKELIAEGRGKEKSSIPFAAYTDYRHVQRIIRG